VDPSNGRRRYGVGQVRQGRLIGMLRGAEMSLAEIELLLAELRVDRHLASTRLDQHLAQLEARHASRRFLIRHIPAILERKNA
jgi:DNA-binding transcriptional MerR regulator